MKLFKKKKYKCIGQCGKIKIAYPRRKNMEWICSEECKIKYIKKELTKHVEEWMKLWEE